VLSSDDRSKELAGSSKIEHSNYSMAREEIVLSGEYFLACSERKNISFETELQVLSSNDSDQEDIVMHSSSERFFFDSSKELQVLSSDDSSKELVGSSKIEHSNYSRARERIVLNGEYVVAELQVLSSDDSDQEDIVMHSPFERTTNSCKTEFQVLSSDDRSKELAGSSKIEHSNYSMAREEIVLSGEYFLACSERKNISFETELQVLNSEDSDQEDIVMHSMYERKKLERRTISRETEVQVLSSEDSDQEKIVMHSLNERNKFGWETNLQVLSSDDSSTEFAGSSKIEHGHSSRAYEEIVMNRGYGGACSDRKHTSHETELQVLSSYERDEIEIARHSP